MDDDKGGVGMVDVIDDDDNEDDPLHPIVAMVPPFP